MSSNESDIVNFPWAYDSDNEFDRAKARALNEKISGSDNDMLQDVFNEMSGANAKKQAALDSAGASSVDLLSFQTVTREGNRSGWSSTGDRTRNFAVFVCFGESVRYRYLLVEDSYTSKTKAYPAVEIGNEDRFFDKAIKQAILQRDECQGVKPIWRPS